MQQAGCLGLHVSFFCGSLLVCVESNVFEIVFGPLFKRDVVGYMFVYLSCCDNATFIGMAETQSACKVEEGWSLLMALDVPSHMVHTVMGRWKRESRGSESRISKGLKLADEYLTPVYVSSVPIGLLEELNECPSSNGKKQVPVSFWKNL
tara:strand:- start:2496 stop:2945 length:450 start_codon:yes stop_codon:yes gene_type:complete